MIKVAIISHDAGMHARVLASNDTFEITEVIPSTLTDTIHDVVAASPDILVLKEGVADVSVDMLCHVLSKKLPYSRSLILIEQAPSFEMLQNSGFKARGYLTPEQWPYLEKAVTVVFDGEAWLPRKLVTDMLNRFSSSFIMVDEPKF
jgi:DNA-binding NarL/FixJ family response regulator